MKFDILQESSKPTNANLVETQTTKLLLTIHQVVVYERKNELGNNEFDNWMTIQFLILVNNIYLTGSKKINETIVFYKISKICLQNLKKLILGLNNKILYISYYNE